MDDTRQPALRVSLVALALAGPLACGAAERSYEPGLPDRMGEACEEPEAASACGHEGRQYCGSIEGDLEWGPCIEDPECEPPATAPCDDVFGEGDGQAQCVVIGGVPAWADWSCDDGGGEDTPLVLRLAGDRAPVEFTPAGSATFDISGAGGCVSTDWPTSRTPWLAIDLDRDGRITDGRELFGSGTVLPDGRRARDGFSALAALDRDGDRRITPLDPGFSELAAWADHDGDRVGTFAELIPLGSLGILAIELEYRRQAICDARGNCEVERARAAGREGQDAEVVDVHLGCQ